MGLQGATGATGPTGSAVSFSITTGATATCSQGGPCTVTANCPGTQKIVSGGIKFNIGVADTDNDNNDVGDDRLISNYPSSNVQWTYVVKNIEGETFTYNTYVICGQ